ncbi:MAG: DUF2236 domain-containing protein [Bacteroidota bacterium]|nr:DUF2236 domain-containing protein [Bacteroidota bacterium]
MGYSKPLPHELDSFRQMGDPVADEVIQRMNQDPGRPDVRALFSRLIDKVDIPSQELPSSLLEMVQELRIPEWADQTLIRKSEEIFRRHGPRILLVLYFKSLPTLYACARGAEVLLHTGRLTRTGSDSQIFARRIAETGKFMISVCGPNGLQNGGLEVIAKVRLIHASVRSFVQRGNWNKNEMGVPINQEDLAVTLQTFSSSVIDGLEASGIRLSADERHAFMHHWKIVGTCLGVHPDLIPDSYHQGCELRDLILKRQVAPSEGGASLTHALVLFTAPFFPKRLGRPSMWIIDYFIEDELAQAIDLKSNLPWYLRFLPETLRKLFSWTERVLERNKDLQGIMDRLSYLLTNGMIGFFNLYDTRFFKFPNALRMEWKIEAKDQDNE